MNLSIEFGVNVLTVCQISFYRISLRVKYSMYFNFSVVLLMFPSRNKRVSANFSATEVYVETRYVWESDGR